MKLGAPLAGIGLLILGLLIFLQHDLRGWTPADYRDPAAVVEATLPDARDFAIGECLPGTISPWNGPRADEYDGHATLTVLSCRSKSRAGLLLLIYVAAIALLAGIGWLRRRR